MSSNEIRFINKGQFSGNYGNIVIPAHSVCMNPVPAIDWPTNFGCIYIVAYLHNILCQGANNKRFDSIHDMNICLGN